MSTQLTSAQLAIEIRETVTRLSRRVRFEPGPPMTWMAVLGRLESWGASSISALAAGEHMRPQSMAQIVCGLEAEQFVSRRPDPADARKVCIELTAAGADFLRATRERRETWLGGVLESSLSDDERALVVEALRLLDRVLDA